MEDQAAKALVGPPSFGNSSQDAAMARLKAIPEYRELFGKAFPHDKDPVSPKNWASAIGAFERTLVVPSRLDSWLLGDDRALEERERRGEAIRVMGITQLGQEIPQEAIEELFQFLCSLTGPLPQGFSEAPVLPAGGFRP